ncbi:riboflavin synthase [Luteimonas vadosa]
MFTGLVQGVGVLAAREASGSDARLRFDTGSLPFEAPEPGESIAVNGVCLTVAGFGGDHFVADASAETLSVTTLGGLPTGTAVNLERALRADQRLGGHLVSGHVDGIGRVRRIVDDGGAQRWAFDAPPALMRYIARKGSICVDGVSLTVNTVDDGGFFDVTLVPHTIAHTAFAHASPGDPVNLEADLVARYVERLLSARAPA